MFKHFTIITLCCFTTAMLESNLKIAIAAKDFHVGNSLVLIACDTDGFEQVAGYVPLQAGKTEFSFDDISCHNQILPSITDQKSLAVTDLQEDISTKGEDFIYLYFEIDATVNIVRAIVITNNLLADNPYNVIEFSTGVMDDEDDVFGDSFATDEFSNLNLDDIKTIAPAPLSYYDKTMLAMYAVWAVKSAQAKQVYKNFLHWFALYHAE